MKREDLSQIHILEVINADIHKKNDKGKSSLQMVQSIADISTRLSLLAALYRRPPPPTIMSEGRLCGTFMNSIENSYVGSPIHYL